jgi:nondiscriminating glutamyl-tRNA synthetase
MCFIKDRIIMLNGSIRVRFAPSPTGYLHIGGLRTALFNFLFARSNNGKFILRIEDTDQNRFVEGALENLISTLKRVGITYDEGVDIGGEFGPYMQSQRKDLYQKYADELIKNGQAYYCFCSPERLEEVRQKQIANKIPPMYDRHCRDLSENEIKENISNNIPYVIRMKIPLIGDVNLNDLIRGEVSFACKILDDQVLVKSDGFPTYHLANVVDDHLMEISHIIRGEEWLPSTPKHVLLYKAFGWEPPKFAHLPLLLNPDRTKLSKRQGDVAVEDFLAKGYLPEAILNFVAMLGWNPGTEKEVFTLQELIDNFSLERVQKAGAVFDIEKLNWMNANYLKLLSLEELTDLCIPFLKAKGYDTTKEKTMKIIEAIRTHLSYIADVINYVDIFYNDISFENDEAKNITELENSKKVYSSLLNILSNEQTVDKNNFKSLTKKVQDEVKVRGKDLFMPIRVALTGKMHGPELPLIADVFGKEECIKRIGRFV